FDDGGADEDVVTAVDEFGHDAFELVFAHLAVADGDAGFGNEFLKAAGDGFDGADAVVEVKHLAAAADFVADRVGDEFVVVVFDDGFYGEAVRGSGFDDAQIAGSGERHVEGAGNWRGAHGKDVDGFAHLFELLFLADTETVFLVDNDQAEI